jgi:hypothetical protein
MYPEFQDTLKAAMPQFEKERAARQAAAAAAKSKSAPAGRGAGSGPAGQQRRAQ